MKIKYIGSRERKADNVNPSRLVWQKGETVDVPDELCQKLLKHPQVWEVDHTAAAEAAAIEAKEAADRAAAEAAAIEAKEAADRAAAEAAAQSNSGGDLSEEVVVKIKEMITAGGENYAIGKELGLHHMKIQAIRNKMVSEG